MDLSRDLVLNPIYGEIRRGIQISLDNECWGAAITLIFSGMDTMANLGRPEEHEEVMPEDFMQWVDRYVVLDSPKRVTPEEMYSARCAVLHTFGVVSRRTKSGVARKIAYTVHGKVPIFYNSKIAPDFLLLDINSLAAAFFRGLDRFVMESLADPVKKKLIEPRLRWLLNAVPYNKLTEAPPG